MFQKNDESWVEIAVSDENSTSQTHTFDKLEDDVEYTIKVKVEDKAGNVKELETGSEKGTKVTTNKVKSASEAGLKITFKNNCEQWCQETEAYITRTRRRRWMSYRISIE